MVDGVCETCRSQAGETSIDVSVPLLFPSPTVDLHAPPVATDDAHHLPTVKSDESIPDAGTRPRIDTPDPIPGIQLRDIIGTGGSATVFRGIQAGSNRECAVKFVSLSTHRSAGDRLSREARAIAALDHPNIVRVYSCDLAGPSPYLVMEYAAGGSLADRLKANLQGLPIAESVALVERVARGIAHAHDRGIIHRDIKPGNLLLDAEGTVKVSDFGLARNFEKDATITKSQAILGTPAYMSPEQARSEEATPQSDVYGIGAVLYDCLTGRPPFPTRDYVETLTKVREEPPPLPRSIRRAIPRDLEAICLKCLEKDPTRRYATANELAEDLARFRTGERTQARPAAIPAWIGRSARKYARVWATAAVILIAILAASAAGPERRNVTLPEDRSDRLKTQDEATKNLQAGKEVEFIGKTDAHVETFELLQSAEFHRPYRMNEWSAYAIDPAIVGVLRKPGIDRYMITGELCQAMKASERDPKYAKAPGLEQVGLILGYENYKIGEKTTHIYNNLRFSEFAKNDPFPQKCIRKKWQLTTESCEKYLVEFGNAASFGGPVILLNPPVRFPAWRSFAVKMTPDGIAFDCEGESAFISAAEINTNRNQIHQMLLKQLPPGSPAIPPRPWNPKEMSVGLWVKWSHLSVRNLVVTPITHN